MTEGHVSFDPATHAALIVELEHVSALKERLDELRGEGRLAVVHGLRGAAVAERIASVPGQGDWTVEMIDALVSSPLSPAMEAVLDTLAERSPEIVRYRELLVATDLEDAPLRLRAELAAFSKLSVRLFGRRTWPMVAKQGPARDDDNAMAYSMPSSISQRWRHLRRAAPLAVHTE